MLAPIDVPMNIGALVVDPFRREQLDALQAALAKVCTSYGVPAERVRVAYAAHRELGPRVIVHLRAEGAEELSDYDFFVSALRDRPHGDVAIDGLGACVSAELRDAFPSHPAPIVWTCLFERRVGAFTVYRGIYNTADGRDYGEDDGPFTRLCATLGVQDRALLRSKLEMPDTPHVPITTAVPAEVAATIADRLG